MSKARSPAEAQWQGHQSHPTAGALVRDVTLETCPPPPPLRHRERRTSLPFTVSPFSTGPQQPRHLGQIPAPAPPGLRIPICEMGGERRHLTVASLPSPLLPTKRYSEERKL